MAGPNIPWPDDQCHTLRALAAAGGSASEIAEQLNEECGTRHSRNAVIGKIARMRIPWNTSYVFHGNATANRPRKPRVAIVTEPKAWKMPRIKPPRSVTEASCASLAPLHIRCVDLEPPHCRWPYGDRDITYCGHERLADHSYCESHWCLSRGDGTRSEREANRV